MIRKIKIWLLLKLLLWYRRQFDIGSEQCNQAFEMEITVIRTENE